MTVIKLLFEKFLRTAGLEIADPYEQRPPVSTQSANHTDWRSIVQMLTRDPLNANLHLQYAIEASKAGAAYLAYAELKTAEYLGAKREQTDKLLSPFRQAIPDLKNMNHNQYFRFFSLSSEITSRTDRSDVSILDVGGGEGQLAAFIPSASYCLAEPKVNGISGTQLPFDKHSFDYVVSCHVLEHISPEKRTLFLDQLLATAKRGVILLNPFHIDGTHVTERLKLFIDITNAEWAREHLDCMLPNVSDVKTYAAQRGLEISIRPNGTLTTAAAFVFVDYFAARAGRFDEWKKVNSFFNEKYTAILDSAEYPNSYLIYLGRPKATVT
jgi:hypothetical protein